jgi:hypothetical protein
MTEKIGFSYFRNECKISNSYNAINFHCMNVSPLNEYYGKPNSQKWAKHSLTLDKLGLSVVEYSLRIVNCS